MLLNRQKFHHEKFQIFCLVNIEKLYLGKHRFRGIARKFPKSDSPLSQPILLSSVVASNEGLIKVEWKQLTQLGATCQNKGFLQVFDKIWAEIQELQLSLNFTLMCACMFITCITYNFGIHMHCWMHFWCRYLCQWTHVKHKWYMTHYRDAHHDLM